jgi:hypothetical protein
MFHRSGTGTNIRQFLSMGRSAAMDPSGLLSAVQRGNSAPERVLWLRLKIYAHTASTWVSHIASG